MKLGLLRDLLTAEIRRRMSYRSDFWISAVSSLGVRLVISYFIVQAVFQGSGRAGIAGFDAREMFLYYVAVILVGKLVQSTEMEMSSSQDIYEGALTRYLLYPVPYAVVKYVQQLGSVGPAMIQIAFFAVWILIFTGLPPGITVGGVVMAAAAISMANLLHFLMTFPLQLISFWAENVWSLMVMHRFAAALLGGMLAPLSLFPGSIRVVLEALPFRYLFAFPVEALMGRVSPGQFAIGMAIGLGWCAVFGLLGKAVWRRGTLQYTGVGI